MDEKQEQNASRAGDAAAATDERIVSFGGARDASAENDPQKEGAVAGVAEDAAPAGGSKQACPRKLPLQAIVGAVAALCVLAILAFGALGGEPASQAGDGLFQPTASSADSTQHAESGEASGESSSTSASSTGEGEQPESAAEEAAGNQAGTAETNAPQPSADAAAANAASDAASPAPAVGTETGAASGGESASTPSSPSVPESSSGEAAVRTVSLVVDGTSVGGPIAYEGTIEWREGMTVYDALVESGVSYNATTSAFGMYVSSIAGLAEKDHGPQSGWKYSVNGNVPQMSASSYALQAGDAVRWFYVTTA